MAGSRRIHACGRNPDSKRQFARLKRKQPKTWLDRFLKDLFRGMRGHFFNLHAAFGRRHENNFAHRAVEHDSNVKFFGDRQSLFNQQPLHHSSFRTSLMRDQRHTENLLGKLNSFGRVLADFHAAALTPASGMNLRFDDYTSTQFLRRSLGFFDGECHLSPGHRDTVLGQNSLGLVFMNFHRSWGVLVSH